ncbi:MAG: isopeptide-forming domain-containing fimbrial protein [Thermosynechococcaceae cyanobacterium]
MRSFKHHHQYLRRLATSVLLVLLFQGPTASFAQVTTGNDANERPITESSEFAVSNSAEYSYSVGETTWSGRTNNIDINGLVPLVDPRGQVLGCNAQPLSDYTGFSVALYEPDPTDPTGTELGNLLRLTRTELPDILGDGVPEGIEPNTTNINPFPLSTTTQGQYSFLLDRSLGQLVIGRTYILVVNAPAASGFTQRRVRLEITGITTVGTNDREQVSYRATSLDGQPIGMEGETEITQSVVLIQDADRIGLQLLAVQFMSTMCTTDQLDINKSGDRANAAPGDTVLYRLTVRNNSDVALDTLSITDVLPMGFKFLDNTVQGEIEGQPVELTVNRSGMTATFSTAAPLPIDGTLTIVYAAQLTPDALRGDGRNSATASANRTDNDTEVRDGPAVHRVRITPGILSDCGTILGRVFVDKNFDGEQQPGEPGVPNAVVYMDDGNRITADEDGLFSVKCVLPGNRTGVLDLTTLPGYTLAPNLKFIERNSPSRLVRLAPGGLVRMNFGVTPTFNEEAP